MSVRVLSGDTGDWDREAAAAWSQQGNEPADVYFSRAWSRAGAASLHDGVPMLFTFCDGEERFALPAIRREIPHHAGWFELESAYGYGGPLATTRGEAFLDKAWAAFADWCAASGIVATFLRCHPLIDNAALVRPQSGVQFDRETVVVDLAGDEGAVLARAEGQHRRNARKARESGIEVTCAGYREGLADFTAIYAEAMQRAGASDFYFFDSDYFQALGEIGEGCLRLFVARHDGKPVAAAIMMTSHRTLHYHLGGALTAAQPLRPMNGLFQAIFRWGQAHGFQSLHLGGGRTCSPDDALLRFKTTLGKGRARFHIAKLVHDRARYSALVEWWCGKARVAERPAQLLFYRLPIPQEA